MAADESNPKQGAAPRSGTDPSAGHYVTELPLAEELQSLLEGRYIVEGFLGQGGMGAVYRGLQMPLKRPVAIKILAKRGADDDFGFEERFKREAYAMAALTHPNIVQVYDCGDAGENFLFISMELVEGGDLSDALKSGTFTPETALKLIPQICEGMQAAHERGIVHRDIKPANIFLTADGRAKVADFGLAKKFDAKSTFVTKTGLGMGTPDYAAPEQYEAVADIDHRADIYSLGVMMYQMLTGRLPRGASYKTPSQIAGTDPRIDAVVAKAMASEREDRYQSVAALMADLAATKQGPTKASTTTVPTGAVRAQARPSGSARPASRAAAPAASASAAPPVSKAARKQKPLPLLPIALASIAVIGVAALFLMGSKPEVARHSDVETLATPAQNPTSESRATTASKPAATATTSTTTPAPAAAKPVKSSIPLPTPGKWVDLTAKVREAAESEYAEDVPGGWRAKDYRNVDLPGLKPVNAVLKVRHRGYAGMALRITAGHGMYVADILSTGAAIGSLDSTTKPAVSTRLGESPLPEGFKADEVHESVFAVRGDELTLWLDGETMAAARDSRLANAGGVRLRVQKNSIIEKVEYAELTAAGAVVAAASTASASGTSAPDAGKAMAPSAPAPTPAAPPSELDQRLAALREGFDTAVERDANTAFKASMATLDKSYLSALDRAVAAASQGGKPDEATSLREEKQRIEKGEGVPSELDESTQANPVPETLKALRKTYRTTAAQHQAAKLAAMQPLYEKYDQALAAVQMELTRASKLDDAKRVQTLREQVTAAKGGAATVTSAAATVPSPRAAGDWLNVARQRGGRLKLWSGPETGQNIALPTKAARYEDYVSLNMTGWRKEENVLFAMRRDGSAVILDFSGFPKVEVSQLRNLSGLNSGVMASYLGKDGKIYRADGREQFDPRTVQKPLGFSHSYEAGFVYAADGKVEAFGKDAEAPPAGFLSGRRVTTAAASGRSFVFITDTGEVLGWNSETKEPMTFAPLKDKRSVEVVGANGGFGFRTDQNEIVLTDSMGRLNSQGFAFPGAAALKDEQGPFLRIQATRSFGAVQRGNGTWVCWGEPILEAKAKTLGPVLDLGATQVHPDASNQNQFMLAWIEMPPGANPPASPAPAQPSTPATPAAPAAKIAYTNTLGMKFVAVPGTEILMCIHETRRKDYGAYASEVSGVDDSWKAPLIADKPLPQEDDHPVVAVNWDDANAFCAWLSKKEGRTYRLPTEHEWNLAVVTELADPGAISPAELAKLLGTQYPSGEAEPKKGGNYEGSADGYPGTAPVMSFAPNRLGIHDLGGNAWEWCSDLFAPDKTERVLRGCGYRNYGGFTKSATRQASNPDVRTAPANDYSRRVPGFRCVVEISSAGSN